MKKLDRAVTSSGLPGEPHSNPCNPRQFVLGGRNDVKRREPMDKDILRSRSYLATSGNGPDFPSATGWTRSSGTDLPDDLKQVIQKYDLPRPLSAAESI